MTTKENATKAVKINVLDSSLQTEYAELIELGEDANLANLQFIISLDEKMAKGLTQEIAKASMLDTAKGVKITPAVRASHIPSVTIAAKIIRQFENEISEIKVSKVLSLAVRVLADKKAKGAGAHIKSFETFEELDENTLTKAESQARDKGEEIAEEIEEKAEAITLETIVDSLDIYLKAQDLKTLKTSEI
jgi:hypothetical protein